MKLAAKTRRRLQPLPFLLCLAVAALIATVERRMPPGGNPLATLWFDYCTHLDSKPGKVDERLVLFAIDDRTYEGLGGYPLDRIEYARMLNGLKQCEISGVVWDLMFAEANPQADSDRALKKSLAAVPGVMPFGVRLRNKEDLPTHEGVGDTGLAKMTVGNPWEWSGFRLPKAATTLVPDGYFLEETSRAGHAARFTDHDGVSRRFSLLVKVGEDVLPSLQLAAAMAVLEIPLEDVSTVGGRLLSIGAETLDEPILLPIDEEGCILIRHLPNWGKDLDVRGFGEQLLSVEEFPEEMIDGLRGKTIFLGTTANAGGDFVTIPGNKSVPGVITMASAVNAILTGEIFTPVSPNSGTLLIVLTSLLVAASFAVRLPLLTAAMIAALLAGLFAFSLYLFMEHRVFLPVGAAALSGIASVTIFGFYAYSQVHRESRLLADTLGRFVSPTLLDELTKDPGGKSVKRIRRAELSILFVDLAGFTSRTERSEPEEIATMLAGFYQIVSAEVKVYGGTLDKFFGDGALVYFGAPLELDHKEEKAAEAALSIREEVAKLGNDKSHPSAEDVRVRCGIATGYVSVGYIGTDQHAAYTVVGRTVNLAARLESSAGHNEVVIDETTAKRLGDRFKMTPLDHIELKGIREQVSPFRLERVTPLNDAPKLPPKADS